MDVKKRTITMGEAAQRVKKGLSPFLTDEEWERLEQQEKEDQEETDQTTAAFMALYDKSAEEYAQRTEQLVGTQEVIRQLNEDLREERLKGNSSISNALSLIGQALNRIPKAEQQVIAGNLLSAAKPIADALGIRSKLDEIITVGSVIVVYRPSVLNMNDDQKQKIRNAITAILTANLSADLEAIQDSIGITVVNIQRAGALPTRKGFNG